MTFHGAFAQTRVQRDYLHLVQMWLWQAGDHWLAYYVRMNVRCGSTNTFVHASAYEGKPASSRIDFTYAEDGKSIEAFQIRPPAPASEHIDGQIFYGGKAYETIELERSAILHSPLYESAPLTDWATTTEWLDIISKGYFLTWQATCPEP